MPQNRNSSTITTGQSLEVQLDKLTQGNCDRIYQEKRSGKTADRPEFQSCMNYLREGDTLIVTRLDRLARSVIHLAQLAKEFSVGEATIYRALNAVKKSGAAPKVKTTKQLTSYYSYEK